MAYLLCFLRNFLSLVIIIFLVIVTASDIVIANSSGELFEHLQSRLAALVRTILGGTNAVKLFAINVRVYYLLGPIL